MCVLCRGGVQLIHCNTYWFDGAVTASWTAQTVSCSMILRFSWCIFAPPYLRGDTAITASAKKREMGLAGTAFPESSVVIAYAFVASSCRDGIRRQSSRQLATIRVSRNITFCCILVRSKREMTERLYL